MIFPEKESVVKKYQGKENQIVYSKFSADLETPVSVALKIKEEKYTCLFESVEGGENRARYSFIATHPEMAWECKNGKIKRIYFDENTNIKHEEQEKGNDPIASLRNVIKENHINTPAELPPMSAGLFGYMGYNMIKYVEKLPNGNPDSIGIPDAVFFRPKIVIIFDSVKDEMIIVSPIFYSKDISAETAYNSATHAIKDAHKKLTAPTEKSVELKAEKNTINNTFKSNTTEGEYHKMVNKAKEYILAGDIFQVVPSQRFESDFSLSAFSLYRALRHINPSPFSFYMRMDDFALVGSSPEILVRLRDDVVTIRPIAGTRKRGVDKQEDSALAADLLSDKKELAEHLMLLDLGRNDVGKVAKPGSVKVTEKMVIEYYSHVMHIVSNVEGVVDTNKDALDALMAGFPAGTVSGAPKIRAMEIIDELEKEQRSFYAGGVGYFAANGSMDSCITLRTALVKNNKVYVQAGGGVVADSDPRAEYQESCNKAKAVLKAVENAKNYS